MKTTTLSLLAGAVLALCVPAVASANLLTNGGFEVGTPVGNHGDAHSQRLLAGDNTSLAGWAVVGDAGEDIAWIGAGHPYNVLTASEGSNFLDLTGWQAGGFAGKGVVQTFDTVAGQQYTVGFDLGNSTDYNNSNGISGLVVSAGSLNQLVSSVTNNSRNAWDHFELRFVAQSAHTTLSFTGDQAIHYIGLDNVSVTAVPEPETYAMLLAGLGVMGAVARRRQSKQA